MLKEMKNLLLAAASVIALQIAFTLLLHCLSHHNTSQIPKPLTNVRAVAYMPEKIFKEG